MVTGTVLTLFVIATAVASTADPGKVARKTFTFAGVERSYFVYEPPQGTGAGRPLVITLHGSGGDTRMLVDAWRDIAEREGIVVMGLQSVSGRGWDVGTDRPEVLQKLVEIAVKEYGVDAHRVHLFGFSAGGHFALILAMLEPEFFASAERRIPIALLGGRQDTIVPPRYMEDTRDRLNARGWQVQLPLLNNDHNYRRIPGEVNRWAWELFKATRLEREPVFRQYKNQSPSEIPIDRAVASKSESGGTLRVLPTTFSSGTATM